MPSRSSTPATRTLSLQLSWKIYVIVCDLLEPLLRKNAVPWCLHVAPHLVRSLTARHLPADSHAGPTSFYYLGEGKQSDDIHRNSFPIDESTIREYKLGPPYTPYDVRYNRTIVVCKSDKMHTTHEVTL
ncbi:hypothetical protein PHET_08479 [Paragonimus heterotremus]|uniref:Uncharacterized protein n=1 Tax=Paragonimus heterotremus TaxID=100268 RepID=A0A8J4WUZ1_9TREM|nr:hypothetical protein PHET_08479 [Paragonimus heterotremus]